MKIEEATQTIKNALDAALKAGICPNLETAQVMTVAWSIIVKNLSNGNTRTEENS